MSEYYYRCEICGGLHLSGFSHDEWMDYQRGLRGWDEEEETKRQREKESLRGRLRYGKSKRVRIGSENKI